MPPPQDMWCSWSGGPVELAASTCSTYMDILHYPDNEDGIELRQCYEGGLDDDSFSCWFLRVGIPSTSEARSHAQLVIAATVGLNNAGVKWAKN